jgi:hypothetical protein
VIGWLRAEIAREWLLWIAGLVFAVGSSRERTPTVSKIPLATAGGRRPSLKARRCLGSEGPAASSVSSEGVVDRGRDADSVFARPGISSRSQLDRILPAGTDTASPR